METYSKTDVTKRALAECGLTAEAFCMLAVKIVANDAEDDVDDVGAVEDVIDPKVISALSVIEIPKEKQVDSITKLLKLKFGTFDPHCVSKDCYVKLSMAKIADDITNGLTMLQTFLNRELEKRAPSECSYLNNTVSHRSVLSGMLEDPEGAKILSVDTGITMGWNEWLDWIWFTYKPAHKLTKDNVLVLKIYNMWADPTFERLPM